MSAEADLRRRRQFPVEASGDSDSPVFEAERIVRDAYEAPHAATVNQPEELWGYTLAAFQTTLERNTANSPDQHNPDHNFSIFDLDTERFPGLQIAFDLMSSGSRKTSPEGTSIIGSIFFTRETPEGRDVLSYSMLSRPNDSPTITRSVSYYDSNFEASMIPALIANDGNLEGSIDVNVPTLTNNELLSVTSLAQYAADSTPRESEASSADQAGYAASSSVPTSD